jgi:hypothetical protein
MQLRLSMFYKTEATELTLGQPNVYENTTLAPRESIDPKQYERFRLFSPNGVKHLIFLASLERPLGAYLTRSALDRRA